MKALRKIAIIIGGIALLAICYYGTYWFDSIKGQEGREFMVFCVSFFSGIGGFVLLAFGVTTLFLNEEDGE